MGFKLDEHVSPLDYDFGDGVAGTVPEPSTHAVNRFFARLRNSVKAAGVELADDNDRDELVRVMRDLTEEQTNKVADETSDALCELTQNHPTRQQLDEVGHRAHQAFLGWLVGELSNPEGSRPATRR